MHNQRDKPDRSAGEEVPVNVLKTTVTTAALLSALALLVCSCASTELEPSPSVPAIEQEAVPIQPAPTRPFDAFEWAADDAGKAVPSPVAGRLASVEQDEFGGLRVVLESAVTYYFEGELRQISYDMVFGGLASAARETGSVEQGETIGIGTEDSYLAVRSPDLDPWMIRSAPKPMYYGGYWWFVPEWIDPNLTQWLTYRPVESLLDAVEDFYRRWEDEHNDPGPSYTIHHYPDLDRIRVKTVLRSFPIPLESSMAIEHTENYFYGSTGHIKFASDAGRVAAHSVVLCWQSGFDQWLREEYSLGDPIWIYCSIYTIDHEYRRILVFVRDFALAPDEEIVLSRIQEIQDDDAGLRSSQ